MTTLFPFTPSATQAFTFQPSLDGQIYTATIMWNLADQRWYLGLTDLSGNSVVWIAVIGSSDLYNINMLAGYFSTSTMVFRQSSQQFEVTP